MSIIPGVSGRAARAGFAAALAVFGFLLTATAARAAEYYVDTGGSDSNSGTSTASAWQTLTKVNNAILQPGDTVYLKRGQTFVGRIEVRESGVAGNPITFDAYGTGDKPIIAPATGRAVDIRSANYVDMRNLVATASGTDAFWASMGATHMNFFQTEARNSATGYNLTLGTYSDIVIQGATSTNNLTGFANSSATTTNLTLSNVSVQNSSLRGFNIAGMTDTILIENVTVNGGGYGIALGGTTKNYTVRNVTIEGGTRGVYGNSSVASNLSFDNVVSKNNSQYGYHFQGPVTGLSFASSSALNNADHGLYIGNEMKGAAISGFTARQNGGSGIFLSLSGTSTVTVASSTLISNGENGIQVGSSAGSILVEITDTTSRNNINDGFNIRGTSRVICDRCDSRDNGVNGLNGDGDGFSWHGTSTGIIRNSFAYNNKKTAVAHIDTTSVEHYNNVFAHDSNGTWGLIYLQGSNHVFYNNTVASKDQVGMAISIIGSTTATVRNNIIYGGNIGFSAATTSSPTYDHNLIYRSGTSAYADGLTPGSGDVYADPRFVDLPNNDYHLVAGSPAVNAGTQALCSAADRDGVSRADGCDMGAYEGVYLPPQEVGQNEAEPASSVGRSGSGRSGTRKRPPSDAPSPGIVQAPEVPEEPQARPSFNRDLRLADSGDDVRALQSLLAAKGFLAAGNDTGYFGPLTKAALASYQNSAGIMPASGYFGPLTRTSITIGMPLMASATTTFPQAQGMPVFNRDLTLGSQGEDVLALQTALVQKGFLSSDSITGYFGPLTKEAVSKYQVSAGIAPASGYFGPKTRGVFASAQ